MLEQVKNILETIKKQPGLANELTGSSNIIDDIGLDSLQMLDFMLKIENDLQIKIDFSKFEYKHLSTIDALIEFLSTVPSK